MEPESVAARDRFDVSLIGSFVLRSNRCVVEIKPNEQRLIALLATRQRPLDRLLLASTLWPDTSERKAYGRLRTALWRCHDTAGDGLIGGSASTVWISSDVSVDLHVITARVREMALRDDTDVSVSELTTDLLEGWYDEWVLVEQVRFRQLRLHALDHLCRVQREAGRYSEALQAGLAAVAAEPLRESAHAEVIRVHLAEGNVGEAMQQFAACAGLLRSELGIAPSPATQALLCRPALSATAL